MAAKTLTPAQYSPDLSACSSPAIDETDCQQSSASQAAPDTRDYQQLFVSELGTIRSVVGYVARRHRLTAQESDEFTSHVYLKLIEDEYLVFRKFQGRSSLRTYLTVIIQRLFLDRRIAQWGKWRPSSFARRHGETAMLLERLTTCRGLSFDDACETLETEYAVATARTELEAIYIQLPVRSRRLFVSEEALDEAAAPDADPANGMIAAGNAVVAARTSQVLAHELGRLAPDDRDLLTSRFRDGLSVADIARSTGQDSKVLYRRLKRVLQELRANLEAHGVEGSAVLQLMGSEHQIDFEWDQGACS